MNWRPLPRFRRGDKRPGPEWYNEVADRLDGPTIEVDSTSGLTLSGRVLSFVMPIFVRPALTSTGLTARSGDVLGEGTVTLYTVGDASGAKTLYSTGRQVTAYNLSTTAVGASNYVLVLKVLGLWIVIYEDCD